MSVFDAELMFRTQGTLTAKETSGPLRIDGSPVRGLAARISLPKSRGTTTNLGAEVWASATENGTYKLIASYEGGEAVLPKTGGEIIVPFATDLDFVQLVLTPGGSTPRDFGQVQAGVVLATKNWQR